MILTDIAICRLSEPIAFMSIFPYIYYMIKSFHITDNEERIALYVGMTISAFAFAEAISSCIWGRISDKFGRKSILLCGLAGTGISMLLFGFATNIYVALLARALGGLLNGNIGVLQTTISEVVKNEAHKGIGFALMPAIWCVGAAIGSALGGSLADPVRSYPTVFPPGGLLDQYPYLLPNLVCCFVVVIAITVGILFLEETHEDLKDHRDLGLQFGDWIADKVNPKQLFRRKQDCAMETLALLHEDEPPPDYRSAATSPDLEPTAVGLPPPYQSLDSPIGETSIDANATTSNCEDVEAASALQSAAKASSGIWNAMSTQLMLNIIGLGLLAYHTISAEQLLPILFSMPESDAPAQMPFWFTGGFALSTKSIGGILSLQGVIQMIATMVVFPYVELRLGTLRTYRLVILTYPLLYILVPYLTLVPVNYRMPAVYAILVWKVTAQAFAFPSNNMMLANSIPKRQRGTFNGVAQSSASLARAIGPTFSGLLEAAGLAKGMLGLPWWVNAFVAVLGAVLSLCMIEQRSRPIMLEKMNEEEDDGADETILPAISPDVDAALVAARSSSLQEDAVISRPSSPLLTRLSLDICRNMRAHSKS